MLHRLSGLRAESSALCAHLAEAEEICRAEGWLDRNKVEELTRSLDHVCRAQREFLTWSSQIIPQPTATMGEMEALLTDRESKWEEEVRRTRVFKAFLALRSENGALDAPLRECQTALKTQMETDGPDLERWTEGCRVLLEQLAAPDYGRAQELQGYQDLFGFPLLAGVYGGALRPEAEEPPEEAAESALPTAETEETQPAPDKETPAQTQSPVSGREAEADAVPPAEENRESGRPDQMQAPWPGAAVPGAEARPRLEGERRLQAAGSKKTQELFQRPEIQALYEMLCARRVLCPEAVQRDEVPEACLSAMVREGYLTQMTVPEGTRYFQASPKLLGVLDKQSFQHYLRRKGLPDRPCPGFDEGRVSAGMLRQVDGVERVFSWLYNDTRLEHWHPTRGSDVDGGVWYETLVVFEHKNRADWEKVWNLFALNDPGLEGREQVLREAERLLERAPEARFRGKCPELWAVVPTRAEIPLWQAYWTERGKTLPNWLALDEPGAWFSPEGERGILADYFRAIEPEEAPAEEAMSREMPPERPGEEETVSAGLEPSPAEEAPLNEPEEHAPGEPEALLTEKHASAEPEAPAEEPAPEEPEPPAQKEAAPANVDAAGPESLRDGLFHLEADGAALTRQGEDWCAQGEFQAGLCLLRVVGELEPDRERRYLQYAYALDDPAAGCVYQPDRLTAIYAGEEPDPEWSCLNWSAHLRMAFAAGVGEFWYQAAAQLQSLAGEPGLERLPALREALERLTGALRERRRGFEPQLIRQCRMWGDTNQKMEELAQKAREILGGKYAETGIHANRIKGLFDALFGPQSELMECLGIVAENQTARRDRVAQLCAPLLEEGGEPNQRAVSQRIDQVWEDQPAKRKQKERLMGNARAQAISRVRGCLEVCAQWLERSGDGLIGREEADQILLERGRLMELFQTAREEAAALGESAGAVILRFTLDELSAGLEGTPVDRREFYVDFLRTGQVELDGDLLPVVEPPEYIIPGCEPWTRLREHVRRLRAGEGTAWAEVVERIWGLEAGASDRYNFGTAQAIQEYAQRHGLTLETLERADIPADIGRKLGWVAEQENLFRAQLELAATYGQIEDHACKERLASAITGVERVHYDETNNWGFYCRTMEACLAAVEREAERLEPRYRYEFDQLKREREERPIFAAIEELLQKKMFSVAHDYMQLVLREDAVEPPESHILQMSEERDALRRFLQEYGPLGRLCMEERGQSRTLEHIYNLFAGDANQDKNRTKRSARQMIRAWPRNNRPDPGTVKELLHCLNLPARQVYAQGENFRAEFEPTAANVFTFPHPIAAFGTRLARTGLNIRVLSGRKTAGELVDLINGLGHTETPTLFLLDYALPLAERNAMAARLRRESAHLSTCLVLDRVLMLFLTGYPDTERGKVLLQCALPFHFYNPYVKGDTPMPPEMFMGRKNQLADILDNGGANIIYGGRQLGKTALLRRAADLADDRGQGRWAVYTDVLCRCDYRESLRKLYAHLTAENFLKPEAEGPESWEELCQRIRARMDQPGQRVERFLLLMDEADEFLESSGACSYRPVECLHQLQTATGGRFKYVLAGLHNVMRFARSATRNNSVLAKLGALTIKPLTYQEARELLEEPLYYLGFRLQPGQSVLLSQILLSTNYYPGLIHFYCAQLVESLGSGTGGELKPPYHLDENQIRLLLQKPDFLRQIREKFFITLDVEEDKLYYRILAYALAYCYYDQPEGAVEGYSFQSIWEVCQLFGIQAITALEPANVKALLSEMEELNVLVCLNEHYTFNGANFRHMMGDYETVFNELDNFGREGE